MKLGGILALAAALVLTGCAPAAISGDPDIQAKADAYSKKVQEKMAADAAAEAEAKLVRMNFPTDHPLRLLITGDSLAGGFYASTQDNGFSKIVQAGLAQKGPVEALGASRAHATLSTVDSILDVPANIDLAIVELGTNDVGAKTDPKAFGDQYGALLDKVQRNSPTVAVLCLSTWQSPATTAPVYNTIIKDKCSKSGGKYVDLTSLFISEVNRGPAGVDTWVGKSDTFHPNDTGHKAIADLILERIKFS